jgi:hypothetical protein
MFWIGQEGIACGDEKISIRSTLWQLGRWFVNQRIKEDLV